MKDKKVTIAIISVIALVLVIIGVTYAYWLVTETQTKENTITTGCLDITLNGKNDIELLNEFPMSDEDGLKLTPYEFTVTNNCDTSVDYQVNLESIGDQASAIIPEALKVAIYKAGTAVGDVTPKILSSNSSVTPTIENAYSAYKLVMGTLASKNASETYNLLLWIDKDAPISEMNKTYESKISVSVGQGIVNPIKEGTLAYDILSNYGGENNITSLSDAWDEIITTTVTTKSVNSNWNVWYGTDYTLDPNTGNFKLSGKINQAKLSDCIADVNLCGRYSFLSSVTDYETFYVYDISEFKSSSVRAATITSANDFKKSTTEGEGGLYKINDDLGTSYYFRGDVDNNYVKLGKASEDKYFYQDTGPGETYSSYDECQAKAEEYGVECETKQYIEKDSDLYWRIVRINGDGTIRLIYDGTSALDNSEIHYSMIDIAPYGDNVGYTNEVDGVQTDSSIKKLLETWYQKHLLSQYDKFIADSVFCNDRELGSSNGTYQYYAAYDRLELNKKPTLICSKGEDKYTVGSDKGNGLLTNPIGLITADEIMLAGGSIGHNLTNNTYYLYDGSWSNLTLTPARLHMTANYSDIYATCLGNAGSFYSYSTTSMSGVRPVINLKADVAFTGDGSYETPYEIVTN